MGGIGEGARGVGKLGEGGKSCVTKMCCILKEENNSISKHSLNSNTIVPTVHATQISYRYRMPEKIIFTVCIIEGNLRFVPIFFDAKKCLYCVSLIGKTWILVCLPFIHVKCLFNWRKNEILYSMSPLYACSVSLIGENMKYSMSPLYSCTVVSL